MQALRNDRVLLRRLGLLLICVGVLLFAINRATRSAGGQNLRPTVFVVVGLVALALWWGISKSGFRKLRFRIPDWMVTPLIVFVLLAIIWEIGYQSTKMYAGPDVEVSRFGGFKRLAEQLSGHKANPPRLDTNQASPPPVQNEQACTARKVNWTLDNIYLKPGTDIADSTIQGRPDYIVRPGTIVTLCFEANTPADLHQLFVRIGGTRMIDPNQDVWQPDASAQRVWYARISVAAFQPEVDETGGYLHLITNQSLANPVRVFVRFN